MEYALSLRYLLESVLRRRNLGWTTTDHLRDSDIIGKISPNKNFGNLGFFLENSLFL